MFLQNLKPAVKKALVQVSESEEDSTQEDEESTQEDEESSNEDDVEQSIVEVEEQEEAMTVEQVVNGTQHK